MSKSKKKVEPTSQSGNSTKPVLYAVGDLVKIIANVDYVGSVGRVIDLNEPGPHPIKVQFEDTWCCYAADEICHANGI